MSLGDWFDRAKVVIIHGRWASAVLCGNIKPCRFSRGGWSAKVLRVSVVVMLGLAFDARANDNTIGEEPATSSFPISEEIIELLEKREKKSATGEGDWTADNIARLNKLLDERVSEWGRRDNRGRFAERLKICGQFRALDRKDPKARTDLFTQLQIGGFSTDESMDIVLASGFAPQLKKNIWVTICLLGPPDDTVRRVNDSGERIMWVWQKFFVHTEDAIVVEWTDR